MMLNKEKTFEKKEKNNQNFSINLFCEWKNPQMKD